MFNDAQNQLLNPLQAIAGTLGGGQDQQDPNMQQAAWNGMGQIGALLMAAGGRMTSQERARLLAGIAPVIGNIPTTALNSAQAQLMQSKALDAQKEQQRQAQIESRLSDPAFAQGLGLTPEQAIMLGAPGAIEAIKARASHDPFDRIYKERMLKLAEAPNWGVVGKDIYNKPIYGAIDPTTGRPIDGSTTGTPAQTDVLSMLGNSTGPEAMEKLKQISPALAAEVDQISKAKQPFPSRKLGTEEGAMLNSLVSLVDPNYDAGTYKLRNDTRSDFQKSTPNSAGGQRQFGNVGMKHMLEIYNNAGNLPNHTNWGPLNSTINQLDIARQEKSAQGGAVNSYKLSVMNGFDEIAKALGIGDAGGRHELQSKLEAANGPEAIRAVIKEQAKLLKEKLDTLQGRWSDQMGPAAGDFKVIDPEAEKALNYILGDGEAQPSAPSTPVVKSIRQIQ